MSAGEETFRLFTVRFGKLEGRIVVLLFVYIGCSCFGTTSPYSSILKSDIKLRMSFTFQSAMVFTFPIYTEKKNRLHTLTTCLKNNNRLSNPNLSLQTTCCICDEGECSVNGMCTPTYAARYMDHITHSLFFFIWYHILKSIQ